MADTATVRRTITEKLIRVQDLGNGVLRGERVYQGKTFATAYIDLSDHVVERADDLTMFQERLLGNEFFKADGDQRWNSYLYFWAGPNSRNHENFSKAKAHIEGDRHFARKFVLAEEDLLGRLDDIAARAPSALVTTDASVQWEELLHGAALSILLEKRPRTQLLELIGSGEAFLAEASSLPRPAPTLIADPLSTGLLRRFRVGTFRPTLSDRDFQFGDVNLIFGQNGAGKTSLLESIEALYCGRVRRDLDATCPNIDAEVVTPSDASVPVKSTTVAATIKARNLAWYGRSNQQSNAITQAFTRFNFLDTDAAFRLSSDTTPDQIKKDLSLLLVGAETSALWTDLCKLREDAMAKRTSINERIPTLFKQTELLGKEVKRLQESPTESTTFAKSFRANLRELGCTWTLGDDNAPMSSSDRSRLESLSRGLRQTIAVAQTTPATTTLLHQRALILSSALTAVKRLEEEHASKRQELIRNDSLLKQYQTTLRTLQTWATYCEAGAPTLAASLERAKTVVSEARVALAGTSADVAYEMLVEYAEHGLHGAIQAATENLALAEQQEKSGTDSLLQRERLGQSLTALRSDLRDLARTILDRAGDTLHCPVCGTVHLDGELLHKIEALTATDDPSLTDGLRQAVQVARERVQRERDALATLLALRRFAESIDPESTATVGELMRRLATNHSALSNAMVELTRLESATESLDLFGVDWAGYADAQAAASVLLGTGRDFADPQVVNARVVEVQKDLEAANKAISETREYLAVVTAQASAAASAAGLPNTDGSSPKEITTAIQRAVGLFETTLAFLGEASQLVTLRNDQPLEMLQQAIDDAMNAFDRAQHAERTEVNARTELSTKTTELHDATEQLRLAMARQENLTKAIDVLSEIVEKHSLEKATQDALESIRGQVSDIFARIHSPAEYILGGFNGEQLLTTRDGFRAHGVSQVSTGQRAALALSIFLALNRSAESAPPVLLIDDPVAHIDDLNALSFLDYLRDLAVSTRKQIFFATADARLAALFQRKFEFLGSERFKKIVLSR
jgi:DNA repair protein SbcC/Rad50